MRATSPPPEHNKIGRWVSEGSDDLLRVEASSIREVLSPLFVALGVITGLVAGVIAAAAGSSLPAAVLIGVLLAGALLSLVYYMRLSLGSRVVEIRCTPVAIEIRDGAGAAESCHLEDVRRLTIVHDGAPAKLMIDAGPKRYRWAIGQLYRHNRVERLVEEMHERTQLRLRTAGLELTTTVRRGVLTTESRRPGHRAKLVP